MRLLVCGGAGFIGSNFVRLRLAGGDAVTVLDKLTYAGRRENLEGLDAKLVVGGIEDPEAVAEAIEGADAVVIVTRWDQFNALPKILAARDARPLVIDGRRMLARNSVTNYAGIGLGNNHTGGRSS